MEAIQFFHTMDATCATRWLSYFDPTVELQVSISEVPLIKRVIEDKQRELFGGKPKRYAIVCGSKSSEDYFFGFWRQYFPSQSDDQRCFRGFGEAYDWLGLSEADRAAVTRAINDWHRKGPDFECIAPSRGRAGAAPPDRAGPARDPLG